MASVLQKLGTERALVVHGTDGLDEITTTAPTKVSELKDGVVSTYYIDAESFGIPKAESSDLKGGEAYENAEIINGIFTGEKGPKRDIVLINAAAALYVAKKADNMKEGIELAAQIIDTGKAMEKLNELREFSNRFKGASA
ncbi:Anthranilate phosphoribosyltransferase [bioreactor metagenome]|uniref:Anthranilate phosphoribosyltransferase n=1 Tax=bioreactor metagenome TaxID=1076179 RepID=A0A645HFM3_9ZZZZ